MSDQCKNCTSRGNFDLCQKTPCHQHTSWMVNSLKSQLANSIPKERIEALIDDIRPGMVNGGMFSEVLKDLLSDEYSLTKSFGFDLKFIEGDK